MQRRRVRRSAAGPAPATAAVAADAPDRSAEALPQGLTVTFWFEAAAAPAPYTATLRLLGRRAGVRRPGPRDSFVRDEVVEAITPGSGPVSVTTRVFDVNPGEWNVRAEMVSPQGLARPARKPRNRPVSSVPLHRAAWSWRRWRVTTAPDTPVRTRFAPLTGFDAMPAVVPGSWLGLVTLGVVLGFLLQTVMVGRRHIDSGRVLILSLLTIAAGIAGGKLWYLALQRAWRPLRDGWCIQGALAGGAVAYVTGLAVLRLPVGVVVDASTPGLFFGVAVGRLGCFLTGCCAGRPSASRWAIWSSDRRVGARRIPTQLLESLSALLVGAVGMALVLSSATATAGAVTVASFAAYTLCRQFLLRRRLERRRSSLGGPLTAALAAGVLLASAVAMAIRLAG